MYIRRFVGLRVLLGQSSFIKQALLDHEIIKVKNQILERNPTRTLRPSPRALAPWYRITEAVRRAPCIAERKSAWKQFRLHASDSLFTWWVKKKRFHEKNVYVKMTYIPRGIMDEVDLERKQLAAFVPRSKAQHTQHLQLRSVNYMQKHDRITVFDTNTFSVYFILMYLTCIYVMRGSVCQYMHLVAMLFGRKGMKFLLWQGAKLCMEAGI